MLEFVALIMFILMAFIVFQKYIVRGFSGRWKSVGDSFGEGRIYDPEKTVACAGNVFFEGGDFLWYNEEDFERLCQSECLGTGRSESACESCISDSAPCEVE